jgi:hypothetical protein
MSRKFDYRKLRGRIFELYESQIDFINAVPMGNATFINKMKGRIAFKNDEIMRIAELLNISKQEIPDYFFCLKD